VLALVDAQQSPQPDPTEEAARALVGVNHLEVHPAAVGPSKDLDEHAQRGGVPDDALTEVESHRSPGLVHEAVHHEPRVRDT
jgi:hypothetical protein